MEFTLRSMTPGDWPEVSAIYQSGIDTGQATFETECPSFQRWDGSHHAHCRTVALHKGAVVGFVAISPISARAVYAGVVEGTLYVHPDFHRRGVGRLLLEHLIEAAPRHGIWTIQAGVLQENAASLGLLESLGFRRVGHRERIAQDRYGAWRTTVLLELRL